LTIGKSPYSTFLEYLAISKLKEINSIGVKDTDLVVAIMDDFSKLIEMEREIMSLASKAGDEGTSDLINKFMQFKEKNNWMLRSFVGKN
jgi:starvation-inducible DNA-binding protein